MLGAIAGDIAGSIYERAPVKTKTFPVIGDNSTYTDDSVLTVAVAEVLLTGGDYAATFQRYYHNYPNRGYGDGFKRWVRASGPRDFRSTSNGAAMRISPVGWAFDTLEEVLEEARRCTIVSHNHVDSIKAAQAVTSAVFLARTGKPREEIRNYLEKHFHYNLKRKLVNIRPDYHFDVSCMGSVPEAIIAFLEAENTEDAIRNAISLGGDSDTMACIAGAIAEAYFGEVPDLLNSAIRNCLPAEFMKIITTFQGRFMSRW